MIVIKRASSQQFKQVFKASAIRKQYKQACHFSDQLKCEIFKHEFYTKRAWLQNKQDKMATHIPLSQILHNLMLSSIDDMLHINKTTLANIQVHLQHAHETIEFLQLESQLQRIEVQEKRVASKSFLDIADHSTSFIQPASSVEVVPVQIYSKPSIKPWEEIQSNKNWRGLGYDKY